MIVSTSSEPRIGMGIGSSQELPEDGSPDPKRFYLVLGQPGLRFRREPTQGPLLFQVDAEGVYEPNEGGSSCYPLGASLPAKQIMELELVPGSNGTLFKLHFTIAARKPIRRLSVYVDVRMEYDSGVGLRLKHGRRVAPTQHCVLSVLDAKEGHYVTSSFPLKKLDSHHYMSSSSNQNNGRNTTDTGNAPNRRLEMPKANTQISRLVSAPLAIVLYMNDTSHNSTNADVSNNQGNSGSTQIQQHGGGTIGSSRPLSYSASQSERRITNMPSPRFPPHGPPPPPSNKFPTDPSQKRGPSGLQRNSYTDAVNPNLQDLSSTVEDCGCIQYTFLSLPPPEYERSVHSSISPTDQLSHTHNNPLQSGHVAQNNTTSRISAGGLGLDSSFNGSSATMDAVTRVSNPSTTPSFPLNCFHWENAILKQLLQLGHEVYELEDVFEIGVDDDRHADENAFDLSGTEDDEEEEGDGDLCAICLFQPKNTTMLPCRHMCCCEDCAAKVRLTSNKCPICRSTIQKTMTL